MCIRDRFPQRSEIAAIEPDNAGFQAFRVEIIIEHKLRHPHAPFAPTAKQKGPALAFAVMSSLPKTIRQPVPEEPGAGQLMPRRAEAAYSCLLYTSRCV